jgi:hypothetical protein
MRTTVACVVLALTLGACSIERPVVATAKGVAAALADVPPSTTPDRPDVDIPDGVEIGWTEGPRDTLLGCARADGDRSWTCITSDTTRRTSRTDDQVQPFPSEEIP